MFSSGAFPQPEGRDPEPPPVRLTDPAPFRLDQVDWTVERILELKTFVQIGKTPWQIAKAMNVNRQTIIRAMAKVMGRQEKLAEVPYEKEPRLEIRVPAPVTLSTKYERDPDTPHYSHSGGDVRREGPLIHIPTHPVELLTNTTCRYPIGDVGRPGFRFCMAPKPNDNRPYCTAHYRITSGRV